MKVLVVYEMVPEATHCAEFEWTEEEYERFRPLAGRYVNLTTFPRELEEVSDELSRMVLEQYEGHKLTESIALESARRAACSHYDAVLVTGFML